MFETSNIHCDVNGRYQGIPQGRVGAIHLLAPRTGLFDEISDT